MAERRTGTYTLADGTELRIQGVSPMMLAQATQLAEARLRAEGVPLDPPRYSVEAVGGDKLWFPHDPSTLDVEDDPAATAENHRAWAAYQAGLQRLQDEAQVAALEAILIGGLVDLPEMPADEDLWRRRAMLGLPAPKDRAARYRVWIATEYITQPRDLDGLGRAINALSFTGVDWDKVAQVKATFPGPLPGDALGEAEAPGGAVDD
jgi:hypothetical protein